MSAPQLPVPDNEPTHRERILFRADASTRIGTGHVMRCLALAQAWQDAGGQAVFVVAPAAATLVAHVRSAGVEVVHLEAPPGSETDAAYTATLARHLQASWVVVDGYHFGLDYRRRLKDAGLQLLLIDDNGSPPHGWADTIVNPNPRAHAGPYRSRSPHTRLLLGARYALLRREFALWRDWQRDTPTVARKLLVTLGGSDPDNVTGTIIHALQQVTIDALEVIVVVGSHNPHAQQLQSVIQATRRPIRLLRHVTDMPGLMAWADMAVSAAGCTVWELAFMGVPALVVTLASNQEPTADWLRTTGFAWVLGRAQQWSADDVTRAVTQLSVAAERRAAMSKRGRELIDGEGAERIVMQLTGARLRLRRARAQDCYQLWQWANDPQVRAVSFSPQPIPWERHVEWFSAQLRNQYCLLFIAVDSDDTPIGQVRYELDKDEATVSISLDQRFRSQGYGSVLLKLSAQTIFRSARITAIHAYVKPENSASLRAFAKAGYRHVGTTMRGAQPAEHFILERQHLR